MIEAVRADGRKSWTLYDNEKTRESERLDELALLRFDTRQHLLARAVGYGSGNIHMWSIIDITADTPRRWTEPPTQDAFAPFLAPGERIGKQYGRGIEVNAGQLEASWLVYRPGDLGCCPSGGILEAQLVPAADALRIRHLWREPIR